MKRRAATLIALVTLLLAATAFAVAPKPPSVEPIPEPEPTIPTAAQYRAALEAGSFASASYEVYRCTRFTPATYTTASAMASTSSGSIASAYMAHNVQLLIDDRIVARSPDVERSVSFPSPTNYFTSLAPVQVTFEISCPFAIIAKFTALGWHKGNSIWGHSHSFRTRSNFHG
jgi:hypothetical protein